jgi:hypothetical protein
MEAEEKVVDTATQQPERRHGCRYPVDEASVVLLVSHGLPVQCRILDLSLEGCRMLTRDRYTAGTQVRVEVTFKINGIAFRFSGLIKWTDCRHLVGIQFVDVITRRRDALAEVLDEMDAANAAKLAADKLKAEQQAEAEIQAQVQKEREATERHARLEAQSQAKLAREAADALARRPAGTPAPMGQQDPQQISPQTSKPLGRERRAESRHGVDTSAVIYLIKIGSTQRGRILDLSASGCRIRTDEKFPVGIYTRVETEFRLEGLPFRLGGVIQSVHDRDRHMVGIRFLDVSDRKRQQVEQLIEEIEESRARKELEQTQASAPSDL